MKKISSFLKNDELVIFTNAYFVFKFIEKLKITGKNKKNIFFKNPVSSLEFNFFSNNQIQRLSKSIFLEDNKIHNTQFIECLKNLTKNKDFSKPAFFHYNLQIHSTSIFINYEKQFIVFFNSSRTSYYLEVLKDICVYLNLIKTDFLKKKDRNECSFNVYIVNSGKQLNDSFCFIYTNIFLKKLLDSSMNVISKAEKVIEVCNSITKEDTCKFMYEEVYLKNKAFIDKGFFNRENDEVYKGFMNMRLEFDDLKGVSCNDCKGKKKSPLLKKKAKFSSYKTFKVLISFNQYNSLFDVCFEKITHTYCVKNFHLVSIQEGFKCSLDNRNRNSSLSSTFEEDEKVVRKNRVKIMNFFDYETKFVQNFERDFSFEYNLKNFFKSDNTVKNLYYRTGEEEGRDPLLTKVASLTAKRITFEEKFVITEKVVKNICIYLFFNNKSFDFPFTIEKNTVVDFNSETNEFTVKKMGLRFIVSKFEIIDV